jgi:CheY-like chemotaxis protein
MTDPASPRTCRDRAALLHDLAIVLVRLEEEVPGLSVDTPAFLTATGEIVEPERGVAARFRSEDRRVEVRLLVSERRVKLLARHNHAAGGWTQVEDRLLLALEERPRLLGRQLASVEALARALVAMAERRAVDVLLTAPAPAPIATGAAPLVVVVDPDSDSRMILVALLAHHGLDAVATSDPDEALLWIRTRHPRLVVGEHPLALSDGRWLCAALADDTRGPPVPFLAVTTQTLPAALDAAGRTHPHGVFGKPVDLSRFVEHVRALVNP